MARLAALIAATALGSALAASPALAVGRTGNAAASQAAAEHPRKQAPASPGKSGDASKVAPTGGSGQQHDSTRSAQQSGGGGG